MKKLSLLFTLILLLASCSENNLIAPNPDSDEGVYITFNLTVKDMQGDNVKSRSVDPATVNEKLITRLWTLQFDATTGDLLKKYYTTIDAATTVNDVVKAHLLLAPNAAGQKSNLYFVANVNKNTLANFYGKEADFKTAVERVTSELGFVMSGHDVDQTQKCIPMSGVLTDKTVTAQGVLGGISVSLDLMLARIDLRYSVSEVAALKFTLQGIRVRNVPFVMSYVPPASTTYPVTMDPSTVQSFAIENTSADVPGTIKQLTFYVPENLRGNGTNTTGLDKLKGGVPFATYFEFSCVGVGSYLGDKTIHKVYPGSDAVNNYDIRRNNKYTLTVTLGNNSLSDRRVLKAGTNCYIVKPNALQDIPVSRANESLIDVQIPDVYEPNCTAFVYWSTVGATTNKEVVTIVNANCPDGTFRVNAGVDKGNAVVAIRSNVTNKILWSWHIWVTDADFTANQLTVNNGTTDYIFMDRNLGALDVAGTGTTFATTAGMLYQWGRKDPFLPAASVTGTDPNFTYVTVPLSSNSEITNSYTSVGAITANGATLINSGDTYLTKVSLATTGTFTYANQLSYSVQSPMLYILNWGGSTATAPVDAYNGATMGADSWGGEYPNFKSVYDPCPKGWRVPSGKITSATWASPWSQMDVPINSDNVTFEGTANKSLFVSATALPNGSYCDWGTTPGAKANYGKYPASGYRADTSGAFLNVGSNGYYWSGSVSDMKGYNMYFKNDNVNVADTSNRAFGFNLRCVRE